MNKYSKLITVLLFSTLICLPLTATAEKGGKHVGKQMKGKNLFSRVSKMQENLGLTDEQSDRIFGIFRSAKENKGTCKDIEGFSAKKSCIENKKAEVNNKISAVLTPEQKTQFDAMKAKRLERKGARKGKRKASAE